MKKSQVSKSKKTNTKQIDQHATSGFNDLEISPKQTSQKYKNNYNLDNNAMQAILSRNMRARRLQLGISQEKLADKTGLHRNYIGGIEQQNRNPSLKNLTKIAKALNIPLSCLLDKHYKGEDFIYAIVKITDDSYQIHTVQDKKNLQQGTDYIQDFSINNLV